MATSTRAQQQSKTLLNLAALTLSYIVEKTYIVVGVQKFAGVVPPGNPANECTSLLVMLLIKLLGDLSSCKTGSLVFHERSPCVHSFVRSSGPEREKCGCLAG